MFNELLADPAVVSAVAGVIVAVFFALLARYVPASWIATIANLAVMIIKAVRPKIKQKEIENIASEVVKKIEEELGNGEVDEEQIVAEVKNQLKKS